MSELEQKVIYEKCELYLKAIEILNKKFDGEWVDDEKLELAKLLVSNLYR